MNKVRTRFWGILLVVVLLLSLLPATALAAENVSYVDENGDTKPCASATDVMAEDTRWSSEDGQETWYVVNNIVTIDTRITVTGDVHLILTDNCTLNANKGIYVGSDSSLTIYGQSTGDNAGQLKAKATQLARYAGIGGNENNEAAHGNITINGGIITAESVGDAAGIGSGSGKGDSNKPNGTITINGGKVTATAGGSNGAGIGGGYFNKITGGDIVINGGTVNAIGGVKAAGIGTGFSDQQTEDGRSITISGGTVIANGGEQAAGIGGGFGCKAASITTITINGGNITTTGGDGPDNDTPGAAGAGIGSGYDTAMTTFISIGGDAVVKATGGNDDNYGAAGIGSGGGTNSKIGGISISGGNVTATGGTATGQNPASGGAGIGTGGYNKNKMGDITISGGDVTATGGTGSISSGAGIGSGGNSAVLDLVNYKLTPATGAITIDGGVVTATGGTDAAGIGNGVKGVGGDFSTGEDGQAIIYAGSISDKDDTGGWNGIIFQGNNGQVYGNVTLQEDLTLESGQTLNVPEGSSLTVPENVKLEASGTDTITNEGTLINYGTIPDDITGEGIVVNDAPTDSSVASCTTATGTLYYNTLEAAIATANSAEGGGTVTLLKDATLSTALDEDVTLSVSSAVLTVGTDGLTNLANGTLEVKAGGGFKLGTDVLVGDNGALKVTQGSVTMNGNTVTLTENSVAEIPSSKIFYLMLGSNGPALNAVIEKDASLTVNGTLKAVSGTDTTGGSQVTVKGTLDVKGTLTIALQADVTVESGGTLNLPAMTKETMGSDTPGEGMKGDIIVNSGANLTYASNDVLGGDNPLMTLTSGTATLNLGNANATEPSVSLTLNGKASVDGSTKALLLASDGGGTIIPIAISAAVDQVEATVSENGVLNLVNGSSLTVDETAKFEVAGILEVHSTASFASKATVSGKVYVFEATNGANPISGANITLTKTGAVYAEKTELTDTTITPAHMADSSEKYTSTSSGVGEKTFAKQWTLSYKITLDANGGTLADEISELWTGTDGKLTAMPEDPTLSGYTFNGWYDTATGGNKVYDTTVFTGDTTIYAQWSKKSSGGTVTPTPTPTPEPEKLPFTDVNEGQWFYEAVKYVYDAELMNGITDTTFEPDSTTTRGMIVTILYRLEGEPAVTGESAFTDVAAGSWYEDAINWAAANEIVNGYGEGIFAPDRDISREEMAAILCRYAAFAGLDVSASDDLTAFPDGDSVSDWAESNVSWAVAEGLLTGRDDSTLDPAGTATRAEIATILMRYCENVAK